MKFGHLDRIKNVDFTLPEDHPLTAKVLRPIEKKPQTYIGCPEWGDPGFEGIIFPKGIPKKDYLKAYASQFNSIELNATGYRIPPLETIRKWRDSVGGDFKFCPKVSRPISGTNPLGKNRQALNAFCDNIELFGPTLGAAFLQLAPTFSPKRLDDLINFMGQWDTSIPLFIELRHADWFADEESLNRLFVAMKKHKIGTVITDTSGRRDALHMCLTTPSAFIRFDGQDLHKTDFARLDQWAERVSEWIEKGLETLYFFLHTPKKYLTPYLANHFIEKLNKLNDLEVKPASLLRKTKTTLK